MMRVLASGFVDAATHVSLRPPATEAGSWTLVFDGGVRGGEIVLMLATADDARRVLTALLDGLPGGRASHSRPPHDS